MADASIYRLRNVSLLVCEFMKKNILAKRTKKSEKTSFFISIKQLPVKPISKKPGPHNVRQLAMVLLKRKPFNYLDGLCWTTEKRDHQYLQNDHSQNTQAGKQTDMVVHLIVRGKWWCTYRNVKRLTTRLTGPGKFNFAYFHTVILWGLINNVFTSLVAFYYRVKLTYKISDRDFLPTLYNKFRKILPDYINAVYLGGLLYHMIIFILNAAWLKLEAAIYNSCGTQNYPFASNFFGS